MKPPVVRLRSSVARSGVPHGSDDRDEAVWRLAAIVASSDDAIISNRLLKKSDTYETKV